MLKRIFFLIFFIPTLVWAQQFVEGRDFQRITNPEAGFKKGKAPVVTEFFSYGCPWCYKMEAPLSQWTATLGNQVQVDRIPVVYKPNWDLYAKAYYTAATLAMADKMSPALFKAIQEDKNPLATKQAMIDFFVRHGVDKEIAKSAFENSPTIDMKVQTGMALMAQYQISGVPAFVVNNKFKTDLQMAGSQERLFEILNYLTRKSS